MKKIKELSHQFCDSAGLKDIVGKEEESRITELE